MKIKKVLSLLLSIFMITALLGIAGSVSADGEAVTVTVGEVTSVNLDAQGFVEVPIYISGLPDSSEYWPTMMLGFELDEASKANFVTLGTTDLSSRVNCMDLEDLQSGETMPAGTYFMPTLVSDWIKRDTRDVDNRFEWAIYDAQAQGAAFSNACLNNNGGKIFSLRLRFPAGTADRVENIRLVFAGLHDVTSNDYYVPETNLIGGKITFGNGETGQTVAISEPLEGTSYLPGSSMVIKGQTTFANVILRVTRPDNVVYSTKTVTKAQLVLGISIAFSADPSISPPGIYTIEVGSGNTVATRKAVLVNSLSSISLSSGAAIQGGKADLSVSVRDIPTDAVGISFGISFDDTALELIALKAAEGIFDYIAVDTEQSPSSVGFAGTFIPGAALNFSGNIPIAEISFNALTGGITELEFTSAKYGLPAAADMSIATKAGGIIDIAIDPAIEAALDKINAGYGSYDFGDLATLDDNADGESFELYVSAIELAREFLFDDNFTQANIKNIIATANSFDETQRGDMGFGISINSAAKVRNIYLATINENIAAGITVEMLLRADYDGNGKLQAKDITDILLVVAKEVQS